VVCGGIDRLFNFARRREIGRAQQLVGELADAVRESAGAHGWLWKLRFAQARAELALACHAWDEALHLAGDVVAQSGTYGRVKYQVAGLGACGQALAALGRTREAIADLRRAAGLARPVGDPAMFLCAATRLLALDGDDALAAEAATAAASIAAALPSAVMQRHFEDAEPLQVLRRLGR
jgi:hypothetical protein